MNRFTKAALVALALTTTAAPIAAQAQNRDRGDRREWRQDTDTGDIVIAALATGVILSLFNN